MGGVALGNVVELDEGAVLLSQVIEPREHIKPREHSVRAEEAPVPQVVEVLGRPEGWDSCRTERPLGSPLSTGCRPERSAAGET